MFATFNKLALLTGLVYYPPCRFLCLLSVCFTSLVLTNLLWPQDADRASTHFMLACFQKLKVLALMLVEYDTFFLKKSFPINIFLCFFLLTKISVNQSKTTPKSCYQFFYPHWSKDLVSPVCRILNSPMLFFRKVSSTTWWLQILPFWWPWHQLLDQTQTPWKCVLLCAHEDLR